MKGILASVVLVLCSYVVSFSGENATALQVFFAIKKVFPETQNVSLLISQNLLDQENTKIARAATQTRLTVEIYAVRDAIDIGKKLKKIPENSILVIFASDALSSNSSRLYILSRCKEKNIEIVSTSEDYTNSGALLGILLNEQHKVELILNLKHSQVLASKFTKEFIQQTGINQIIE